MAQHGINTVRIPVSFSIQTSYMNLLDSAVTASGPRHKYIFINFDAEPTKELGHNVIQCYSIPLISRRDKERQRPQYL